MDYEKKYKEALERARQFSEKPYLEDSKGIVDYIFPELKESEDERIRKWLIHYFKEVCDNVSEKEKKGIVAWLEKQPKDSPVHSNSTNIGKVEQKPDDKVEPKFKVGDVIKPKDGGHEPWKIMQVDILNKKYRFKDGYVIHFSQEDAYELVEQKHAWSDEDEKQARQIERIIHDDGCTQKLQKQIADWFKSLKDRVLQKPAEWSEEDEKMFEHIIAKATLHFSSINYLDEEEINFLKSLRPQPHWKPSDEQMEVLESIRKILHADKDIYSKANNLMYNFEELIRTLKKN